jgi:hypothetical protein
MIAPNGIQLQELCEKTRVKNLFYVLHVSILWQRHKHHKTLDVIRITFYDLKWNEMKDKLPPK